MWGKWGGFQGQPFTPTTSNSFMLGIVENTIDGGYCKRGDLVLPLIDVRNWQFRTLQTISSYKVNGKYIKGFYPVLSTKYACYKLVPPGWQNAPFIYLAEGLFTGLAVLSMTRNICPVICAMNVGNLTPIAEVLRKKFPNKRIIDMVDNDAGGQKNRGVEVAEDLKKAGLIDDKQIPTIHGMENQKIDWDDYLREVILCH